MLSTLLALLALAPQDPAAPQLGHVVEPLLFVSRSGAEVEAELHELTVPAVRGDPSKGDLPLRWILIPGPEGGDASPVVYLAGGPGGSGIDACRGRRWPLADELRKYMDVVLLDQRGTGTSAVHEPHLASVGFGTETVGDREAFVDLYGKALDEAVAAWTEAGVPLAAYTTAESAADLVDIADALGVDRLSLVGISYGSHLALAAMKLHPDRIDRVVLASVEGPDDTVKRPARTDAYFARLQRVVDADPEAKKRYGDVAERIRRVMASLAESPRGIQARNWRGGRYERTLGAFAAQRAIGYVISDPDRIVDLLEGLRAADVDGDFSWFEGYGWLMPGRIRLGPMSTLMDLASGISDERLELVSAEARTGLLADAPNFPMPQLLGRVPGITLPQSFRAPTRGDRPTLILSGTLDGRTYPESAAEAAAALDEATVVTIENGGHNLFFDHPSIVPAVAAFLAGEAYEGPRTIAADPPRLARD